MAKRKHKPKPLSMGNLNTDEALKGAMKVTPSKPKKNRKKPRTKKK